MKVLMINGSPRDGSNTLIALKKMQEVFDAEGIDTEILNIGKLAIRGCQACGACKKLGKCVFNDDIVNEVAAKFAEADGLVVGSPVYYASANGTLISLLDRLFYSTNTTLDRSLKVGAAVAVARRAGCSATLDVINKYFTNCGMVVASGSYWNLLHGGLPGETEQDSEGIITVRNLAANMAFLIKSIALGREKFGDPEKIPHVKMNFIR